MSIEGARPFRGFSKLTSDKPHGSDQADERGSDSCYNHHRDNARAFIFEAAYVAKRRPNDCYYRRKRAVG